MALTNGQKSASRKTVQLLTACIAAAVADNSQSGLPTVKAFAVGTGAKSKFSAEVTYTEDAGVTRTCMVADSLGKVRSFTGLSDILAAVVTFAPKVKELPVNQSFSILVDNPEKLADTTPAATPTVPQLIGKLGALRKAKNSATLQAAIRGLELVQNAAYATGTPEQVAKFAEATARKATLEDLAALYVDQDAALVSAIEGLGGVAPV